MNKEKETTPFKVLLFSNPQKQALLDVIEWGGVECEFINAQKEEKAHAIITKDNPDVILVDFDRAGFRPLSFVDQLIAKYKNLVIIGLTEKSPMDIVVKAIKMGAHDVIHTTENPYKLQQELSKLIENRKSYEKWVVLHEKQKEKFDFHNIVGQCSGMHRIFKIILKIARQKWVTVLIRGETGTGKELIARAIHYKGENSFRPFIEINCNALPENLLESELFGYEKGAFTDAKTQKKGLFEMANDGTLFLDEIGEITPAIQMKLLRALEEKQIRHLGGTQNIYINTRIIAATNRDLRAAIKEGSFRSDLYYRLNVISIQIPPLRERQEDVILLARTFLGRYAEDYGSSLRAFTPEAEAVLGEYHWPGNVRELKHTIERIVLLNDGKKVGREILEESIESEIPLVMSGDTQTSNSNIETLLHGMSLDEGEKILIQTTLEKTGWNKRRTCTILNVSRPRLDRKIEKYNLMPHESH